MIAQELLDKIARLDPPASDELEVPPRELIAFFVRFVRGLRQWKQSTLADFARVSVSTVERVERGENVSDECLDRIAEGLGYERGYFTVPRSRLSLKEAADQLTKKYGELEAVKVGPLRTQRQLRELAKCHAILLHRPEIGPDYNEQVEELKEWLDLTAFILGTEFGGDNAGEGRRRSLYDDVLACVRRIEQRGATVPAGVMAAPQPDFPEWSVAVVPLTPKLSDPGAAKRDFIFVDRRCVTLRRGSEASPDTAAMVQVL